MTIGQAKERREAIIAREFEITVLLTESKRAWIVDKVEGDFGTRTTLEAELATLAAEKHSLTKQLHESKFAMKAYRNTLAHAILIRLVTDRGMGELVIQADRSASEIALMETAP
jgi:hypothetical protein